MSAFGKFARKVIDVVKTHGGGAIPTSEGDWNRLKPVWDYFKRKFDDCVKGKGAPEHEDEESAGEEAASQGSFSPKDLV